MVLFVNSRVCGISITHYLSHELYSTDEHVVLPYREGDLNCGLREALLNSPNQVFIHWAYITLAYQLSTPLARWT